MKYTLFRIFHTQDADSQVLGAGGAYSEYIACYPDNVNLGKDYYATALVSAERCLMGPSTYFPLVLWYDVHEEKGIDLMTNSGFCVHDLQLTQGQWSGVGGWNLLASTDQFEALKFKRARTRGRAAVRRHYNTSEASWPYGFTQKAIRENLKHYRRTSGFHRYWLPAYQAIIDTLPYLTDEADLQPDGSIKPALPSSPPSIPVGTQTNGAFKRAAYKARTHAWWKSNEMFGYWLYAIAAELKATGETFIPVDFVFEQFEGNELKRFFEFARMMADRGRVLSFILEHEGAAASLAARPTYTPQWANYYGLPDWKAQLDGNVPAVKLCLKHLERSYLLLTQKQPAYSLPANYHTFSNDQKRAAQFAAFQQLKFLIPYTFSVFQTYVVLQYLWVVKKPRVKKEKPEEGV